MIEVIKPGMLTSVQDLGRYGYRHIGVGVSGAMDDFAFTVANLLIGNSNEAAGLEVTLGGCVLKFTGTTTIALTGSNMFATLDGQPIRPWSAVSVKAGQVLKTAMATQGLRSYIAVAGGIDVPVVMGSRSTDLKASFGGFNGRALKKGDHLTLLKSPINQSSPKPLHQGFGVSRRVLDTFEHALSVKVRIVPAAQWGCFSEENQRCFLASKWLVTPQSNRLGYLLSGPVIKTEETLELLSHGILPGCVQMPPSGQPVIQLNDANTCGGYPKLGVVIKSDLRKLAQVRPSEFIQFELCTPAEAVTAHRLREEEINTLRLQAESMRNQLGNTLLPDSLLPDSLLPQAPSLLTFQLPSGDTYPLNKERTNETN